VQNFTICMALHYLTNNPKCGADAQNVHENIYHDLCIRFIYHNAMPPYVSPPHRNANPVYVFTLNHVP
jgi:hypothetical protein